MRPNGWNQAITLTTRSMSVMAILRQLRRFPNGIAAGINSGLTTNWELLHSSAQMRLAKSKSGDHPTRTQCEGNKSRRTGKILATIYQPIWRIRVRIIVL